MYQVFPVLWLGNFASKSRVEASGRANEWNPHLCLQISRVLLSFPEGSLSLFRLRPVHKAKRVTYTHILEKYSRRSTACVPAFYAANVRIQMTTVRPLLYDCGLHNRQELMSDKGEHAQVQNWICFGHAYFSITRQPSLVIDEIPSKPTSCPCIGAA